MYQSRTESLIEACINVGIGFIISIIANFIIFPIVGVVASVSQVLWIGTFMTVVSITRSYFVRRFCQANLRKMVKYISWRFNTIRRNV